ncbi:hypothetical protein B0H13DRAFT_1935479 [Mycena leptocephala]|nr:hypothetical protein B0H13DRAFT_1935479 [Mycena leptocephala]
MPLFDSASGLQITGGTFIDNTGDININTMQLQLPGQDCDPLQALELLRLKARVVSCQEWRGMADRLELRGGSRMVPDDVSWATSAASISSLSNPPSFPFSHPEHNFDFSSFFESPSTINGNFPSAPDSTVGYPELFQDSINSTTFEYPSSNPAPMSGTHGYYGQILPSENQPIFEPTSTTLVLNSEPFAEIFSEQTQPRVAPSFHPSNTTADVSFDFLLNSDFLLVHLVNWWWTTLEPKTNIHGGTFIDGNVNNNNIEHHGEAGAGKSAISQSLCQKLEAEGCFGGAFSSNVEILPAEWEQAVPTLAYQLSRVDPN